MEKQGEYEPILEKNFFVTLLETITTVVMVVKASFAL
jgi:hypothetical protein